MRAPSQHYCTFTPATNMDNIIQQFRHIDIYLLDQILKGRYQAPETVLDAGAGGGRNLPWFIGQGIRVFGTDRDPEAIAYLKSTYPHLPKDTFRICPVEKLPFPDTFFHHVVSSAVLHFADNHQHFEAMFGEMVRVLKPGGSLFIRATTDVGLSGDLKPLGNGRYWLRDESERYLMTQPILDALVERHQLHWLEPFKTVVVDHLRSMAVIVLGK